LVVVAEANGGGQAVCSQWMAMPDGGSALSLFCVFFFLCFFFSPFLYPASLSLLPLFFFSFLTMAQGGVAAVAMGGTAMAESRHSGCDNQCCCFPSSSQCCSSGDGEEQQWRSRWCLLQWSSSPLFCFSLSPLFRLVSYLCFPVSVFFFIQLPSLFPFFSFSPPFLQLASLFSPKNFSSSAPLPVFILFFAVYSLAVAVLSVVLVVVAGGHGGERNRERSSCWEPGQKMIVS
jgi:hypothetical protein